MIYKICLSPSKSTEKELQEKSSSTDPKIYAHLQLNRINMKSNVTTNVNQTGIALILRRAR
jgi:hypothetical protein